jgi:transcriptional regulator with XRE-family HTH domain
MDKFNIGEEIEKVAKTRRLTSAYIAKKLGKTRSNMNHIFKRKTIDADLLYKLSVILDFNFFDLYANSLRKKMGLERGIAPEVDNAKLTKTLEAHEKNAATQSKYIELLEEKINALQKEPEKKSARKR